MVLYVATGSSPILQLYKKPIRVELTSLRNPHSRDSSDFKNNCANVLGLRLQFLQYISIQYTGPSFYFDS